MPDALSNCPSLGMSSVPIGSSPAPSRVIPHFVGAPGNCSDTPALAFYLEGCLSHLLDKEVHT